MAKTDAASTPAFWLSRVPDVDDFGNPIHNEFIDGVTRQGPWALMTPECHRHQGMGLGMGRGQHYKKQADDNWKKVAG